MPVSIGVSGLGDEIGIGEKSRVLFLSFRNIARATKKATAQDPCHFSVPMLFSNDP
jgi:hypothetical protein